MDLRIAALPEIPPGRITVEDRRAIRAEMSARLMAALDPAESKRRLSLIVDEYLSPMPRCEFCGSHVAPRETTCADCACLTEDYCAGESCDCRGED